MKIGVMTLWTSKDNYGQLLQGWALQRYLRCTGNDAYIIRYAYQPGSMVRVRLKGTTFYRALRSICNRTMPSRRPQLQLELLERRTAARRFDEVRKNALVFSNRAYSSLAELRTNPPEAELYSQPITPVFMTMPWMV